MPFFPLEMPKDCVIVKQKIGVEGWLNREKNVKYFVQNNRFWLNQIKYNDSSKS